MPKPDDENSTTLLTLLKTEQMSRGQAGASKKSRKFELLCHLIIRMTYPERISTYCVLKAGSEKIVY